MPYRLRPALAGLKNRVRAAARGWSPAGPLPGLLIIGAQKAGTTSLWTAMAQDPQLSPSKMKEVHFADVHWERGADWYRRCFPTADMDSIAFEATPNYLFFPHAAARMAQIVPDAKLVAILRDPVRRALSHHAYETARGGEHLPFDEAIAAEATRTDADWARAEAEAGWWSFALQHHGYLRRGLYAEHLDRWRAHFPPDALLVMEDRALYNDPASAFEQIYAHIGRRAPSDLHLQRANIGSAPVQAAATTSSDSLYDYFRHDTERLAKHYGSSFSWLDRY